MRNDEFAKPLTSRMEAIDALATDLKRSMEQCRRFAEEVARSHEAKDAHDLLLIRFGRLFDAFYHHLRTLLNDIAREEKSEILISEEEVLGLREIRNNFVHKYLLEEQPRNYQAALEHAPCLLGLIEKVRAYTRQPAGLPKVSLPLKKKRSSLEM
jgi:hypothetical protein